MNGIKRFIIILLFFSLMAVTVQAAAPNVTVVNPDGGTVSGTIVLEAVATDSDGNITKVDFYHNANGTGWILIGSNTSKSGSSYYRSWATTGVPNGNNYSIRAIATDNSSLTGNDTSNSPVTVANIPPTVTVLYPDGGEILPGLLSDTVTILATASDDVSVDNVQFFVSSNNGSTWASLGTDSSSPYTYLWDTTAYPNGTQYRIKAEATDDIGLKSNDTSNSNFTILHIPNMLPTVSVVWPNGNETISNGTITVKATASDPDGLIDKVDFYYTNNSGINKYFIATATAGPNYQANWNTASVANGANYRIIAEATDNRSGTKSDMSNNTFTIANNRSPTLTNGQSNVSSGVSPHKFRFTVTYTDVDNDPATFVKIYIEGVAYSMTAVDANPPSAGKVYKYEPTLTAGATPETYQYYFEASDGKNPPVNTLPEKTVTVNPATFESGNRIWDESKFMSSTYTWNPQSFSGFYYNLDTNEGSEKLTIKNIGRTISDGNIVYETSAIPINFDHSSWGTYNVIGFMAERYFAGYTSSTTFAASTDNLMAKKQLSKVLIDDDKSTRVSSGAPLKLQEGYEFRVSEFGTSGNSVMVALFKDGSMLVEDIKKQGETFVYEKDLGSASDVPIIAINIDTVFLGMERSTIMVEGIFQISEHYIDVDPGDEFGQMKISSVSSSTITMKNDGSVSLSKGSDFNLMGKINIIVADSSTLRFAPYVDISEPGTYELRGTVTGEGTFTWTPLNFEALLFDMDTGFSSEQLTLTRSGTTVNTNQLVYTTTPILVNFEQSDWKQYQAIGFMGEKYFAGYLAASPFMATGKSLLKYNRLSKVLLDDDKRYTLRLGSTLTLQEGYSIRIDEISRSGNALMLTVMKNGEEMTTDIMNSGDDLVYEVDVGNTEIPIIVAHIDEVFMGMESSSVFIEGIFQVSDKFTTVNSGDTYDKMKITKVAETDITMKNDESFTLSRGSTISIMGDISFKVADATAVRFYPFQEIVVEEPLYLELDTPKSVYENEEFNIKVTSDDDDVKGASIIFDDVEIGSTDSRGELSYTPTETGTFTITASKSGYKSASKEIEVLYQPKILAISAPLIIDRDEKITISVTSEGSGVSGVSVKFGSRDLGTTPASGNITYTPDEIGTFTIMASRSGYQDASREITITDPAARLVFSNLSIKPKRVNPGEIVSITVDAGNFGTIREAETVYLNINGKEEQSLDLILGPGEITTLGFKVNKSKPGLYRVEFDGRSDTFRVMGTQIGSTGIAVAGIIALLSIAAVIYSIAQGNLTFGTISDKFKAFKKMLGKLIEKDDGL